MRITRQITKTNQGDSNLASPTTNKPGGRSNAMTANNFKGACACILHNRKQPFTIRMVSWWGSVMIFLVGSFFVRRQFCSLWTRGKGSDFWPFRLLFLFTCLNRFSRIFSHIVPFAVCGTRIGNHSVILETSSLVKLWITGRNRRNPKNRKVL